MDGGIGGSSQVEGQVFGQSRAYVAAPRPDPPHRLLELFRHAFFRQVTSGAGFECTSGILPFGMHAEQKDRQLWPQTMQVIQDVKNDDIPVLAAHMLERFLCRFRFPKGHPGKCFTKGLREPPAKDCVVVSNKNSHHDSFPGKLNRGSGIRNVMVVPEPSTPSILNSPLSKSARSCIPTRPRDLRAFACSASKPLPLS